MLIDKFEGEDFQSSGVTQGIPEWLKEIGNGLKNLKEGPSESIPVSEEDVMSEKSVVDEALEQAFPEEKGLLACDWLRFLAARFLPRPKTLLDMTPGLEAYGVLRELATSRKPVRKLWGKVKREELVSIAIYMGVEPPGGKRITLSYKTEVYDAVVSCLRNVAIEFGEEIPSFRDYRPGSFKERAFRFGGWLRRNWKWLLALFVLVLVTLSCSYISYFVFRFIMG